MMWQSCDTTARVLKAGKAVSVVQLLLLAGESLSYER